MLNSGTEEDDAEALLVADVDPERARTKRIERRGSDYFVDRIADF